MYQKDFVTIMYNGCKLTMVPCPLFDENNMKDINGKDLKIGDIVYYARCTGRSRATLVEVQITDIKGGQIRMGRFSCHGGDQLAKIR